jgi:hypothetical protein
MFDFEDPETLIRMDYSNAVETQNGFKQPDLYAGSSILKQNEAVYNEELELVDGKILERAIFQFFRDGVYKGNLRSYVDITIEEAQKNITKRKEKYSNIIAKYELRFDRS